MKHLLTLLTVTMILGLLLGCEKYGPKQSKKKKKDKEGKKAAVMVEHEVVAYAAPHFGP